jgi:hypothetical protein
MNNSNTFVSNITNIATTENGAISFKSSLNSNVDFFFHGASIEKESIIELFEKAYNENKLVALKNAFYLRDIRDGEKKKDVIEKVITFLNQKDTKVLQAILPYIPVIGSWKDVFKNVYMFNEETLNIVKNMIELVKDDSNISSLMAKWMPRKGENALILTKLLNFRAKEYRQFVVSRTNVVEQLMCSNRWDEIDYSKLPSVASKIYQKTFWRHSTDRYEKYLEKLEKGETKINSSVLFPHDIISMLLKNEGDITALNAQWNNLPNYMENSEKYNVFPVIDTSGSMESIAYGTTNCMSISVGLGIYMAQHNRGAFKNIWCNFSTTPQINELKGNNISEIVQNIDYVNWGNSTNIQAVFDLILNTSINNKVLIEDMPKTIVIVSDMQFDRAINKQGIEKDIYNYAKNEYKNYGYELPNIVFWNVDPKGRTTPIRFDEYGSVLIGGYSPSILKEILSGDIKNLTPLTFMLKVLVNRYKYLDEMFKN